MTIRSLFFCGTASTVLFWLSVAGVTTLLGVTVFAVYYHRRMYPGKLRPSYDESFRPRCCVVLPCKGVPRGFEQNIRSFLTLDYPDYEVMCAVEDADDPAALVIRKIVAENDRVSLVVAGLASRCGQKNHNMLAAIRQARDAEVYVFADSDIRFRDNWLKELVLPLSDPSVTVATGFRWLYSSTGGAGQLVNSYQNTIVFILFTVACFMSSVGLWGGSMAIRKKDFEEMGVGNFWAQAVVDDSSLSRIVRRCGRKSVMVSTCVTASEDALESVRNSTAWFQRQVMYLKMYQRPQWYAAIGIVSTLLFYHVWGGLSLAVGFLTERSFVDMGGASVLLMLGGIVATVLLYPLLGRVPWFIRYVVFLPLSLLTVLLGVFKTLFTNTIVWSGVSYSMNVASGTVTSVSRS